MTLAGVKIEDLKEADLQKLIGSAESSIIDFKRDQYSQGDSGKKEFAADVSSFANSAGGHLILGIEEHNSIATSLVGVNFTPNSDQEQLRLEQVARSGIRPKIAGVKIATTQLNNGNEAMIIEIPRSFAKPHRVEVGGSSRFYARAGKGKYEPDVAELRSLFEDSPAMAVRIRDFRLDRIAQLSAGLTPVPLNDYASGLVLHILPLAAFEGRPAIATDQLKRNWQSFYPIRCVKHNGAEPRPTLEGIVIYDAYSTISYTHIWRTGQIEAVLCPLLAEGRTQYVMKHDVLNFAVNGLSKYVPALQELELPTPYAVAVTLFGVNEAGLSDGQARVPQRFKQDNVHTSVIIIEELSDASEGDLKKYLHRLIMPCLDEIANAAGSWSWNDG